MAKTTTQYKYDPVFVPTGRSSETSNVSMHKVMAQYNFIKNKTTEDTYNTLDLLCDRDSTVSKVKTDFVNLVNAKLIFKFEDVKLKEEIEDFLKNKINVNSGGISGLINIWATQMFTYSVMTGEVVIGKDKKHIEDVVVWNPATAVFLYNNDKYILAQRSGIDGSNKVLPPSTCFYYTDNVRNDEPYGIPKILPVIKECYKKNILDKGLENQIDKWGYNLITGTVNQHKIREMPGESYEDYKQRINSIYTDLNKDIESKKGGQPIITSDAIELKVIDGIDNAQNVETVNKMNMNKMANALNTDKSMINSAEFNTDVYGTVQYKLFLKQVENTQNLILRAIKKIVNWYFWLQGKEIEYEVMFEENEVNDTFKQSQSQLMKVRALLMLWEKEIISSDQVAKELGYDKAFIDITPVELEGVESDGRKYNMPTSTGEV